MQEEWIMEVKARDLMRTKVETLSPEDTVETALARFEEIGIGGAPVMADGRLVGMLTLTDVARTEHLENGQPATRSEYAWGDPEELEDADPEEVFYRDNYSPEVLGRALVGDWMSRGVVSVPPEASLQRVCQVMVREQIHRVCVTSGDRLVGLITSFDVVRHLAGSGPGRSPSRARRAARGRTRKSGKQG
jgi:CBS domain-containing protein